MLRTVVFAALIALPGIVPVQAALAQQGAVGNTGQPPQRIRSVTLTGGQACPKAANNDEIVVCSRADEPYRIPKAMRDDGPIRAQNQSWVNRAATMDRVGRVAGGTPDTCSPVGTGGQTGCTQMWNRNYAAERRARASDANAVP